MSTYAVQQAIFDHLRDLERVESTTAPGSVPGTAPGLTEDEARALREGDVAAFYAMGVHPVLINGFCRANGWRRADYRVLFPAGDRAENRRARWLTS